MAAAAALATPVAVTAGAVTSGRNFALVRGGRIAGSVTASAGGAPIAGIQVVAYRSNGVGYFAQTGASGAFEVTGLPNGEYLVTTYDADSQGYLNEAWNNLPCPLRCTFETGIGTPVAATVENVATGINFSLATGGQITGTITDAASGAPLAGVVVSAVRTGVAVIDFAQEVATNASGVFTVRGLPPGVYYAFTSNNIGYVDEYFGGIPCFGECDAASATIGPAIAVAPGGSATAGFELAQGGRIRGRLRDAGTSAPVSNLGVIIYDSQNRFAARAFSNGQGDYATGAGLPAGTYYAVFTGGKGYSSQFYGGVACVVNCGQPIAAGTPIAVTAGATAAGRDFALVAGGRIRGTITQQGSGVPIQSVSVSVYDSLGRFMTFDSTDASGLFTSEIGLPTGNYYLATSNFGGYANEIYDNRPCSNACVSQVTTGTAVTVTSGVITAGIDMALAPLAGPPAAPVGFAVTGAGGVRISWRPGTGPAPDSYRLEAGFAPGATALSIPVSSTSYLAAGVPPGRYYVRVRGVNSAGTGPASSEVGLTVGAGDGVAPGRPESL